MDSRGTQTVVIGAGPAGLATAAQLRRLGVPVVVLERANAVAASWRGRYDRLRLNSSRPFSKLPGARYPRGTGMFPSRDQVVEYLESYARDHELEIRFRTHVERIERDETAGSSTRRAVRSRPPTSSSPRATSTPSGFRSGPVGTRSRAA